MADVGGKGGSRRRIKRQHIRPVRLGHITAIAPEKLAESS